jgi:hypothetical protein
MIQYNIRIGLVARICRSQSSKDDQFRQGRGSIPRFGTTLLLFVCYVDPYASGAMLFLLSPDRSAGMPAAFVEGLLDMLISSDPCSTTRKRNAVWNTLSYHNTV